MVYICVVYSGVVVLTHNAANAAHQERVAGSGYALFLCAHFELVRK